MAKFVVKQFVGSWGLISFEHALPSGEVQRLFGDSPLGLLIYQADGHMSTHLSDGESSRFASEDLLQASSDEASGAFRKYIGYWGTFEVSAEKGVVVHRVKGSSFPNWIGTEQVRHFRFDEPNRLTLEAQVPSGHSTLIWQRISG